MPTCPVCGSPYLKKFGAGTQRVETELRKLLEDRPQADIIRMDADTTANIGIIQGGGSGNIVPDRCFVEGETRSLVHASAIAQRDHMAQCFQNAADKAGGSCKLELSTVYTAWSVEPEEPICRRFHRAAERAGLKPCFLRACGGSDASFLSAHGIRCLVLATGMHEIHSVREYTTVGEMENMAQVVKHLMCDSE